MKKKIAIGSDRGSIDTGRKSVIDEVPFLKVRGVRYGGENSAALSDAAAPRGGIDGVLIEKYPGIRLGSQGSSPYPQGYRSKDGIQRRSETHQYRRKKM